MVTMVLTIKLLLPGVSSLKEKRRILKSLLAKLKNNFNVSAAEVGDNDIHRQATIGIAVVSNDSRFGHEVCSKIINRIESMSQVEMADIQTESY